MWVPWAVALVELCADQQNSLHLLSSCPTVAFLQVSSSRGQTGQWCMYSAEWERPAAMVLEDAYGLRG